MTFALPTLTHSLPRTVWQSLPYVMAIMTIRSTYALDVETVRTLERLALRYSHGCGSQHCHTKS
jgi:hypothetical protein